MEGARRTCFDRGIDVVRDIGNRTIAEEFSMERWMRSRGAGGAFSNFYGYLQNDAFARANANFKDSVYRLTKRSSFENSTALFFKPESSSSTKARSSAR
jgi:hypothetical protein